MGKQLITLLNIVKDNYYDILISGVIMVCSIIVFIGILKPLLFNRIKCKPLRKTLLAFSNIGLSFLATFLCFWIKEIEFEHYLYGACAVSLSSIIVYWFYENTCLRNLIGRIGNFVLKKIAAVAVKSIKDGATDLEKELKNISSSITDNTKSQLKTAFDDTVKDKELKNL